MFRVRVETAFPFHGQRQQRQMSHIQFMRWYRGLNFYFVKELLQELSSVWCANNFRGHVQRVELRLRRGLWVLDSVFCYDVNWLRKMRYTSKLQRVSQKFSASQ